VAAHRWSDVRTAETHLQRNCKHFVRLSKEMAKKAEETHQARTKTHTHFIEFFNISF